jgi:hypothetical protein
MSSGFHSRECPRCFAYATQSYRFTVFYPDWLLAAVTIAIVAFINGQASRRGDLFVLFATRVAQPIDAFATPLLRFGSPCILSLRF